LSALRGGAEDRGRDHGSGRGGPDPGAQEGEAARESLRGARAAVYV